MPPIARTLIRRLAGVLAPALLLAALGCREDAESPTAPKSGPALDITPAHAALSFRQVSAGGSHTCAVATDDRAYCWGVNGNGQLGIGTTDGPEVCLGLSCSTRPVAVLGGLRFRQVSAGTYLTCGVTTDYRAYCWSFGGDAGYTPVAVPGGLHFRQVSVGNSHRCGVTTENRAYCWGYNGDGQLGDGTLSFGEPAPVAVVGQLQFRQVSAGGSHTCAVTTDDRAYCWGRNIQGQVGDSTEPSWRPRPTRVAGTRQWRQIDAGLVHTCAVTTSDRAFCWGNGRAGQLGTGKAYLSFWPRAVSGGLRFKRVTAGVFHTCGETTTNRAYCWGGTSYNNFGQLGDGTTTGRLTPVAVAGGLYFRQLSAGDYHTCGKTSTDVGYCWGYNAVGQLGDGTTIDRPKPRAVVGPS
jgi:alpha-tubulin suppressor-like RCC1 family protein